MQTLDFNQLFTKGWEAFIRQIGMAIVWTLVYIIGAIILAITVVGIIILPVWVAGYLGMMRTIWHGGSGEFGDFFKHMGKIGNLWAAFILVGICVSVGSIFLIIPGIILLVLWSQTILLIIDKNLDAITAMTASWNRVKDEFWMVLAVLFIVWLINFIGGMIYIGSLLTISFGLLVSWALYYALFPPLPEAATAPAPAYVQPTAVPPPPPPPPSAEKEDEDEGMTLD